MKKRRNRFMAVVVAVCCMFSMSACAAPEEADLPVQEEEKNLTVNEESNNEEVQLAGTATALVRAEYPEMVQYPVKEDHTYSYEDYEAWMTSKMAQQSESKDYQNGIREFYEITMQEFLKDTQGENKVYSPLNVYMALAMLAETTDGESRQQILDLLHTDSMDTLRNNASILWNANYCDDGTVNSLLASSVWLSDTVKYNEKTLKTLADNYYASSFSGTMGSAEYNKMLQDWLNEQTGGLLQDQAGNVEMDAQTIFALATTVYFRAKWDNEFRESNNTEEIFHAASGDVTAEFMHQTGTDNYYWGENFGAISRSLKNSGRMFLILPDEDVAVEDLLNDKEVLNFIYERYNYENKKYLIVNQSVPKFDVVSDYSLIEGLKNLGVTDVFDVTEANFSSLVEQTAENEIFVSEAKHAVRVMIDEEGCAAAAYTVMLAAGAGAPPEEEIDFVLNRPFLFVIKGQDGQPLFIGIVNQPN